MVGRIHLGFRQMVPWLTLGGRSVVIDIKIRR